MIGWWGWGIVHTCDNIDKKRVGLDLDDAIMLLIKFNVKKSRARVI